MKASQIQAKRLAEAFSRMNQEGLESLEHADTGDLQEMLEHLAETNPALANKMEKVLTNKGLGKQVGGQVKAASVTLRITRTITKGNAILTDGNGQPVNLPAPLFGILEYESCYSRVLASFLPKDGSVLVKSFAKTLDCQSVIFTFKNADDSVNETVTIVATNSVYTNLIRGLQSAAFTIMKPKIIISDAARVNQFEQPINIFRGSMFTAASTDNISPQDYKTDYLSDDKVRILQDAIKVDPEQTIVPSIVPPTITNANGATFSYNFVCPLSEFRKFAEYANREKAA